MLNQAKEENVEVSGGIRRRGRGPHKAFATVTPLRQDTDVQPLPSPEGSVPDMNPYANERGDGAPVNYVAVASATGGDAEDMAPAANGGPLAWRVAKGLAGKWRLGWRAALAAVKPRTPHVNGVKRSTPKRVPLAKDINAVLSVRSPSATTTWKRHTEMSAEWARWAQVLFMAYSVLLALPIIYLCNVTGWVVAHPIRLAIALTVIAVLYIAIT
jgi:hypothetical protein